MRKLSVNSICSIQVDYLTKKINFVIRDGDNVYVVTGITYRNMTKDEQNREEHIPDQ